MPKKRIEKKIFQPQEGPQTQFTTSEADICVYGGAAGGGKALVYGTNVITPYGEKPIEDLVPGNMVCNPDGSTCQVLAVFDHEDKDLFEITFNDGTSCVACDEHQWISWRNDRLDKQEAGLEARGLGYPDLSLYPARAQKVTTADLIEWMENGSAPCIPVTRPAMLTHPLRNRLPLNPYILGAMLVKSSHNPAKLGSYINKQPVNYQAKVTKVIKELDNLSLLDKDYQYRDIPNALLYGSLDDRIELFQGICDNSAIFCADGDLAISLPKGILFDNILHLARGLGCVARYQSYRGRDRIKIRCSPFIIPFQDKSKLAKYKPSITALKKIIKSITPVGKGQARCITVSHPNSLYMIDDFNVTHNTFGLLLEPLKWLNIDSFHTLILRRTSTEITQPGGLWDESMNIYPHFGGEAIHSRKIWKFPNGNKIQMMDLEHDKTLEKRKGVQAPLIMMDELNTFTERMFFYMMSRNRSATKVPAYFRASTNPAPNSWLRNLIDWWLDDEGFPIYERSGVLRYFIRLDGEIIWGATKQELIDMYAPKYGYDVIQPKSFTFIPAKVDDNKLIDPTYKSNLLSQSRVDKAMLLDGCWDVNPDAGTYFSRDWVKIVNTISEPCQFVRYWDRAATEPNEVNPNPDWTAGVLMAFGKNTKQIYVVDVQRFRKGPFEGRQLIKDVAKRDQSLYGRVKICIEKDPGQAGVVEAKSLAHELMGYEVAIRSTNNNNKLTRFIPFSSAAERGDVCILAGTWNEPYFNELEMFVGDGKGKDDQVDGTSGAYAEFINPSLQLGKIALPDFSSTSIITGV